uniref:Uncharacterized protein n=1 Tax=Anguilla anguilla TaxID=7936 RepID=A0A0E9R547_ANGAN
MTRRIGSLSRPQHHCAVPHCCFILRLCVYLFIYFRSFFVLNHMFIL